MNPRRTLATARRVLLQLRHDPRTVALMLGVPCLLITLLKYVYDGRPEVFDRIGAPVLGVFPLLVMFVVTAVATLRERTGGTLERLLTMPLGKLDLLVGYALAFGLVALVQGLLAFGLTVGLLGLTVAGPTWMLLAMAVADGLLGMALGLFVSAFATTEFQAVQFLPAFLLPQLLLCGLFTPRAEMSGWLHALSDALPLSYAVDAMNAITTRSGLTGGTVADLLLVLGCAAAALALGAATLRRRTA
ncbi:ABC transporter permease [Streptomyces sp. FH025]|uniref:ABC transporter permease n=1 Tax=Streptomyces sp. FH025 TaxID=2815937 RepID=UPI001A9CDD61|nr:ABC transporter permease [Streptomyces sp. FH025]MBO1413150.1 ABC transporter permease [Streptomyces sp. FH025]